MVAAGHVAGVGPMESDLAYGSIRGSSEGALMDETSPGSTTTEQYDAVIIGAGFSGLYMLHRLRSAGRRVHVLEAAGDVGGTWWWNRYPGARCDIESFDYSYSFDPDLEQDWSWSERYATQPEILRYVNHVADRFSLREDISFTTRMLSAHWQHSSRTWRLLTDTGRSIEAQHCIMAVGCLSRANRPALEGLDRFTGRILHTGEWPHDGVDVTGLRVGVIGTGSSGIQSIPILAEQCEELTVFQRTPAFTLPAMNAPLDPDRVAAFKARYREHREATRHSHGGVLTDPSEDSVFAVDQAERDRRFDEAWRSGTLFGLLSTFNDLMIDPAANEIAADFVRQQIASIVEDPTTAAALSPRSFPIGTKRLCLDTGYYATFNRPNVSLVDLRADPIDCITASGIRTSEREIELDVIVFATGFDAMTGALLAPEIIGRDGISLREKWQAGPRTYLGIASSGFPNLFTITGPGSPSVLTNMLVSIEQHVDWTADCIDWMDRNQIASIEPSIEAEDGWVDHVNEVAGFTLYPTGESWYLGANIEGKPRVFMPYIAGVEIFRSVCDSVAAEGYRGFVTTEMSQPVTRP